MKHIKIKLSVLALACLGAGALALQPAANAKAETSPADCLTMVHGASVCVADTFSGIRWTTKINTDAANELIAANEGKEISFGTLVMPTSKLGDDGLTEEDTGALDLPASIDDYTNLPNVFYSVVNYDDLGAEHATAAYALELTARSYVKIDGEYYFVELETVNTSRSARQVALAAELAGDWDDTETETAKATKAATYYGMTERYVPDVISNGAKGTSYVDLSLLANKRQTASITVDLGIENYDTNNGDTGLEVMIDAQRMTDRIVYKNGEFAFYIPKGTILPTGEHYVSVFFPDGTIKTIPFICATMAFDSFDDFDMFAKIRENIDNRDAETGKGTKSSKIDYQMHDGHVASDYEFDGYYVLAKALSWTADDTVRTDVDSTMGNGWRSTAGFAKTKLGLTGTFNGLGHTIKGFQDGRQYTGLFQLVNGGTIKNTYFYNYTPTNTRAQVLAHYLIDPKIENVFIYSKDKMQPTKYHYILGSYLYQTKEDAAKLSNVLVRIIYKSVDGNENARTGGLFSEFSGKTQAEYNWNNVYVATNIGISSRGGTESYFYRNDAEDFINIPKFVAAAENQKTDNGYALIEWRYQGSVGITLTDDGKMTATFTSDDGTYDIYSTSGDQTSTTFPVDTIKFEDRNIVCLKGVYWYYDINAFNAAKGDHNGYKTFLAETGANCWKVTDGVLSWKS